MTPKLTTILMPPDNSAPETEPDPFDLDNLRLDQNFLQTAGTRKLLKTIPVRKPGNQDFIRVHPSENFRLPMALLELKNEREMYVCTQAIAAAIADETIGTLVYTAISRLGVLFLWPVRLPSPDGRTNAWHQSARTAAEEGMTAWIRVKANMALGAYEIFLATASYPDPVWPELDYQDLIKVAFRDRIIDRVDHPVLQRLQGRK